MQVRESDYAQEIILNIKKSWEILRLTGSVLTGVWLRTNGVGSARPREKEVDRRKEGGIRHREKRLIKGRNEVDDGIKEEIRENVNFEMEEGKKEKLGTGNSDW